MIIILITVILTAVTDTNGYRSSRSAPLIKNVFRGGDHLEGPHWSVSENALYFVDITGQKVHRLDGFSGNVTTRQFNYGPIPIVVSVAGYPKLVLVGSRASLNFLNWDAPADDNSLRLLSVVDLGLPDNRINDGKVDSKGRLWFGTMGKEESGVVEQDKGTLYMINEHNYVHPEEKVKPVSVSNGIAWTSDYKYMFYIDTPTRNIDVFDFDLDNGAISNRRTLFGFKAHNVSGLPDGMTIDSDGNLWVACFLGGKVIKIDSRGGTLLEQHNIPASQVSSVMWGGPDLSTLYVTTSKRDLTAAQLVKEPEAGSLFEITSTGSRGLPENQFVFKNADKY